MRHPIQGIAILGCSLALLACAPKPQSQNAPAPAKPDYKKPVRMNGRGEIRSISFDQFYLLHEAGKTLVIDARLPLFHRMGHIPGSINIPLHHCDAAIHRREAEIKAALAAGKTIVTYCSGPSCPDARSLARHLSGFGYPASVFSGGWESWSASGL